MKKKEKRNAKVDRNDVKIEDDKKKNEGMKVGDENM